MLRASDLAAAASAKPAPEKIHAGFYPAYLEHVGLADQKPIPIRSATPVLDEPQHAVGSCPLGRCNGSGIYVGLTTEEVCECRGAGRPHNATARQMAAAIDESDRITRELARP